MVPKEQRGDIIEEVYQGGSKTQGYFSEDIRVVSVKADKVAGGFPEKNLEKVAEVKIGKNNKEIDYNFKEEKVISVDMGSSDDKTN